MTQIFYTYLASPVGRFFVAGSDAALVATGFEAGRQVRSPQPDWRCDASPLTYALEPLRAYFAGERTSFDVPLVYEGTPFQQAVWSALQQIPYGVTTSYGDIARAIGNPQAVRAVGAANGANVIPVIIPCHRVIGSDGSLTGFGGGLSAKQKLLQLEGVLPHTEDLFGE
ncbi:MAG: methylated-DNA--[protein]-cysteine S-methyltransferase [Pseudomonadota bacterium]